MHIIIHVENPDALEMRRVDTKISPCAINNFFIFYLYVARKKLLWCPRAFWKRSNIFHSFPYSVWLGDSIKMIHEFRASTTIVRMKIGFLACEKNRRQPDSFRWNEAGSSLKTTTTKKRYKTVCQTCGVMCDGLVLPHATFLRPPSLFRCFPFVVLYLYILMTTELNKKKRGKQTTTPTCANEK